VATAISPLELYDAQFWGITNAGVSDERSAREEPINLVDAWRIVHRGAADLSGRVRDRTRPKHGFRAGGHKTSNYG
jgi:hypothetical protein